MSSPGGIGLFCERSYTIIVLFVSDALVEFIIPNELKDVTLFISTSTPALERGRRKKKGNSHHPALLMRGNHS